jgi:hypothetical protein
MKIAVKIIQFMMFAGIIIITSCNELPDGQTPTAQTPPSPVMNVAVESMPGGAKITYDIPASDKDISYVKAEYTYKGEKHIVRTSVYTNYLVIEGLGSVEPVDVILYLVDHSENISTGVHVSFTPDTPPFEAIYESMELLPDFGGIKITWQNDTNTEIGITVFIEDSLGIMQEQDTHFSKEKKGKVVFRGYELKEYHFAAHLTDKWGNISGTKNAYITPLFERLLDKSKFFEVALPGDNTSVNNNRPLKNCWDGDIGIIWHTVEGQFMPFPMYVTIDLGVLALISRMSFRARTNYYYYNHTWKTFEVWAAKDYKRDMPVEYWTSEEWKTDGDWSLLADCEVKRPSGNPEATSTVTGEDLEYGQRGYEFEPQGDNQNERFRYLRIVIKSTWATGAMHMAEFYFYGWDL